MKQLTNTDCLQAVLSELLDVPYPEIPSFSKDPQWRSSLYDWLENRGYSWLCESAGTYLEDTKYLIYGMSPRDYHVVIALNGEVIFDPHPSDDGLVVRLENWIIVPVERFVGLIKQGENK